MTQDYQIVVDSREQKPWWTDCEVTGLKTGDYSIKGFEDQFAIERKSLADFHGSLTSGHTRFRKELERAKDLTFFCIIVEGSYSDVVNKRWDNSYRSKIKGYVVASIANTLEVKHGVRIIYANDRTQAKERAKALMTAFFKQTI